MTVELGYEHPNAHTTSAVFTTTLVIPFCPNDAYMQLPTSAASATTPATLLLQQLVL